MVPAAPRARERGAGGGKAESAPAGRAERPMVHERPLRVQQPELRPLQRRAEGRRPPRGRGVDVLLQRGGDGRRQRRRGPLPGGSGPDHDLDRLAVEGAEALVGCLPHGQLQQRRRRRRQLKGAVTWRCQNVWNSWTAARLFSVRFAY